MTPDAKPVSPRADLIGGLVWIALGTAIVAHVAFNVTGLLLALT